MQCPEFIGAWARGSYWGEQFDGEAFVVKPNDGQNDGGSTLHYAGARNAAAAAEVLIDHGADLEALGFEGNMEWCTPLVLAAFSGADRIDVVRVLLRHHANPDARSSAGETALMTAIEHGEDEIVNALIDAGAHVGVHEAAALGQVDELAGLLDASPGLVDSRDTYRYATPLYYAACRNQVEAIDLLMNRGADVDAQDKAYGDSNHWTPLIRAGDAQCQEAVCSLLEHGASPDFATLTERWGTPAGSTILHIACRRKSTPISLIEILLEHGADVSVKDDKGQTPLEIARSEERDDIVQVLMRKA